MFYDVLKDDQKAYQLSLIAAYLSPQDANEWIRLYEAYKLTNLFHLIAKILIQLNLYSSWHIAEMIWNRHPNASPKPFRPILPIYKFMKGDFLNNNNFF